LPRSLLDLRFVVLSGKGGVGRTTVAAALARAAAAAGKRVLIAQTSAPERLGAMLGRPGPVGPAVVEIDERISAVNMTPQGSLREYGLMTLRYEAVYRAVFENKAVRGFLAAVPGLDAYAMFGKAWFHTTEQVQGRPKYDLVILDAPATGHAVTMLRLPQAILDGVGKGPLIKDARAARDLLSDAERAALVIATLAEELPAREAVELARAAKHTLGIPLGPLIVNALPSDRLSDPDVAGVLDKLLADGDLRAAGAPVKEGDGLDGALRVATSLRTRRATADQVLATLRADPGLPMICLPRLHTADLGASEIARLATLLAAALSTR